MSRAAALNRVDWHRTVEAGGAMLVQNRLLNGEHVRVGVSRDARYDAVYVGCDLTPDEAVDLACSLLAAALPDTEVQLTQVLLRFLPSQQERWGSRLVARCEEPDDAPA